MNTEVRSGLARLVIGAVVLLLGLGLQTEGSDSFATPMGAITGGLIFVGAVVGIIGSVMLARGLTQTQDS